MSSALYNTIPIYGSLPDGKVIQIASRKEEISGTKFVGGKIFYIDSTSSGATYTFYNSSGTVITDIQVGDEPYAYTVTGTPDKDKYYVFNDNIGTDKMWTYINSSGSYVNTLLNTTDGIGAGKTNTNIVMAASSGAYASYSLSLWNYIQTINTNSDKGCNDWYAPSMAELEALRTATDRTSTALTTLFTDNCIWSSYEYAASYAWDWRYYDSAWKNNDASKYVRYTVIPVRSF